MIYSKPELRVLGDAAGLVQHVKQDQLNAEAPLNKVEIGAAYETEE
jgi:hypothetical protein